MNKIKDFIKDKGYIVASILIVASVLFLLLPILSYEIREAIYDGSGERLSKTDFVYDLHLWDYFAKGFSLNFTMYMTLGVAFIAIVFIFLGKFVKKELSFVAILASVIVATFVLLAKEFFSAEENNIMDVATIIPLEVPAGATQVNEFHGASVGIGSALSIVSSIAATVVILGSNIEEKEFDSRSIAEDAILIAMAFALNFVKIPVGITGGSINFQILPLFIIALRRGPIHGFVSGGIVYGLLSCLTDGYGFVTYPFDYLIAFGSVGILGLFNGLIFGENQTKYNFKGVFFIILGGVLATLVRFVGSTASSMLIYKYDLVAAMAYNAVYIPFSGIAAIMILVIIYDVLIKINRTFKTKKAEQKQ